MFAALSGVASFHRACLLAQDFTHEPACQTGERAPQGRFRHQPEQMVHPPFAWQLASFPSLPVCGEEAPYCPLRDFATLRAYSPEIKAQQAIFAFLPVYPELVGVVGSRVPDYRGRFLRGLQPGHSVGQTVANSLKSHNDAADHTHSFSGQLVSLVRLRDNLFLLLPALASPVPLQNRRLPTVVLGGRVFPIRGVHQSAGDTLFFRKKWGIPCLPTTRQKPTDMHREEVFTSDEPIVTEILIRCMSQ